MSTGTLTLTQNSTAVVGSGTLFTTELDIGGVVYVSLNGINHTLVVSSIASNTQLTLARAYTGATQSGVSWTAVPRDVLIGIHAQLAADNVWSRRAAVLDKQNWYQVFTGTGTITVTLPDGSTYSGPAWNAITTELSKKANSSDLGTAASLNAQTDALDTTAGRLMRNGAFGLGGTRLFTSLITDPGTSVGYALAQGAASPTPGMPPITSNSAHAVLTVPYSNVKFGFVFSYSEVYTGIISATTPQWRKIWFEGNTTVDSSGFIKKASPIVKIFSSGKYELNDESEGVTVTRLGVGQYLIEGCEALNSDASWGGWDGGFDIPTDRNKQPLIWLDYEVNPDGSVLVKTYHRTYPDSPEFARNLIGRKNDAGEFIETIANGEPVDIPSDQFVSVRVEMPENSVWKQRQAELAMEAERLEAERLASERDSEKG